MSRLQVHSFALGEWVPPGAGARSISDAVTGEAFAEAGTDALDFGSMRSFARETGGPKLRAMTFMIGPG